MPEFRIQRCLGRGGFGEVYRGVMSRGGGVEVEVAIKVLRPDLKPESQGVQRLRDEGRLLGRLTHPSILRVYDLVVIQGRAALVSEYVAGEDLGRLLRESRIPPRAAFEVMAQVGAALDAAWSWPSVTDGKALHLVHRDIKPDNIRLDPHGGVKLLDFGIAQAQTVWREAQTSVNTIMGSTHYLAPERLVQQEVGPESDIFALGCTLFEALTGEALFARKSMRQMYMLMVDERRFEEFMGERCGVHAERLGGEQANELLRAMTAWRKQSRPTGAEVASRCDLLSDNVEGATLTQWCRARIWPAVQEMEGPLDGFTFVTSQPFPPGPQPAGSPGSELSPPPSAASAPDGPPPPSEIAEPPASAPAVEPAPAVAEAPPPAPPTPPPAPSWQTAPTLEPMLASEFRFDGPPPTLGDGEEFATVRIVRVPRSKEPPPPGEARPAAPAIAPEAMPLPIPQEDEPEVITEVSESPLHRPPAPSEGDPVRPQRLTHRSITWTATASGAAGLIVGVMGLLVLVFVAWIARG